MAEKPIAMALGIAPPARNQPAPPPRLPVRDDAVLDSLTHIKRCVGGYEVAIKEVPLEIAGMIGSSHGDYFRNQPEAGWKITVAVQLPGTKEAKWTESQEQAYVQSVLKGLVKPHFIVNHVRNEGRLLSGVCRLKALRKWSVNELPVLVNGKEVFKDQLLDADRIFFSRLPVTFAVYDNLTKADENELMQTLACPSWH
jgi:hypothetical protein